MTATVSYMTYFISTDTDNNGLSHRYFHEHAYVEIVFSLPIIINVKQSAKTTKTLAIVPLSCLRQSVVTPDSWRHSQLASI